MLRNSASQFGLYPYRLTDIGNHPENPRHPLIPFAASEWRFHPSLIDMEPSVQLIRKHAASILRTSKAMSPSEFAPLCNSFLKSQSQQLFFLHQNGSDGLQVAQGRCVMIDALLHHVFLNSIHSNTVDGSIGRDLPVPCLIATGGYGRGELCPNSDIDILFLFPGASDSETERLRAIASGVLYTLWDLGLKVGHAVRTIEECLDQCAQDMHAFTALLEARLVEGDPSLFRNFQQALTEYCTPERTARYIQDRMEDQRLRHARYGGSVFVQEPNVKNGCGGLRDAHNLLWIARAQRHIPDIDTLCKREFLSPTEANRLTRAYSFLIRVRNELHYSNQHAVDQIALSAQPVIAEALGFSQPDVLRRIETFMRCYYRQARGIYVLTEALAERLAIEDPRTTPTKRITGWHPLDDDPEKLEGGLVLRGDLLECTSESRFPTDPHDLLQVFRVAQLHHSRIGFGLQSRIRHHLELINPEFLRSRRARDIFLSILGEKGEVGRTLRMMHECGVLGRYLPEFGRLNCLVQHEFYHRYTADEHTLLALEQLDSLLASSNDRIAPYGRILKRLENTHLLYLALLLHDTGKALNRRHHTDASAECSQQVARRLSLDSESLHTLLWLVDHHMTMFRLVRMRDLDDPATIEDFKSVVGSQEHLDMLHLLTYADEQGVGDTQRNEWRMALFWQLYEETSAALSRSGVEIQSVDALRENLRSSLDGRLPMQITRDEVEAHFRHMPGRYWRRIHEDELAWHMEIVHGFFEELARSEGAGAAPTVRWRHFPEAGCSEVVICTWNRHGLFAKIAGSFSASRINILNADIYTREDNVVLDIFQVCDLEHHAIREEVRLRKMATILSRTLSGPSEIDFAELIRKEHESMRRMPHQEEERFPTTITFNNEDSAEFTILEIQTPDRLGLLYHILDQLARCGIDINLAKINTVMGAAMDVFYLTDDRGNRITETSSLHVIQQQLRRTIEDLNEPFR
jgi:[protein-PII] uridylyltransferase